MASTGGIELKGPIEGRFAEILTPAALDFVAGLQRELGATRAALLRRRAERQATFDAGGRLDFLTETRGIRDEAWTVAPAPKDLEQRWVELTGPAERKMAYSGTIPATPGARGVEMIQTKWSFVPRNSRRDRA